MSPPPTPHPLAAGPARRRFALALGALAALPAAGAPTPAAPPQARALAVLGDSDSHSYQDQESFPPGTSRRGGALRAHTLQWTEVLARLRPRHLDLGPWESWGASRWRASLLELAGVPTRVPRKQDYRHNFAVSGATCDDLLEGQRQARHLVRLMDSQRQRWRDGVVLVRIGINSLGTSQQMSAYARDGLDATHAATVQRCLDRIGAAVRLIRQAHPDTRIVLVGMLDNADWPPHFDRWQAATERARIGAVLDAFDHGLAAWQRRDPRVAFFDDRANFRRRFGGRAADGRPAYTAVTLGRWRVTNSQGDAPGHGVVADGHAGTITNTLWVRDLIDFLNERFALQVPAVTEDELVRFLDATLPRGP